MPIWKFAANSGGGEALTDVVAGGISSELSLSSDGIEVSTNWLVLYGQTNSESQLASLTAQSTGLYSYSEARDGPYTPKTLSEMSCLVDGSVDITNAMRWSPPDIDTDYSFGIDQAISQRLAQITVHALCYAAPGPEESARPNTWVGGRTFSLYRSDDNLNWTHVENFSDPRIASDTDYEFWFVLALTNPQAARYFKICTAGSVYVQQDALNYCSIMVSEIKAASVHTTVVSADAFQLMSTLDSTIISNIIDGLIQGCIVIHADINIERIFIHRQVFSPPTVIITREPLTGRISLQETLDAIELLGGDTLELADPADSISFSAEMGTAATLLLSDPRDAFASLNGGVISLADGAMDALFLTGLAASTSMCAWGDSLDTLEIDALSGAVAELDAVDAADLLSITGQPETTGGVSLTDAVDAVSIQAMGGLTASGPILLDALDRVSMTAAPEETGVLALLDFPDLLQLAANSPSRFATHIIQYQKARY